MTTSAVAFPPHLSRFGLIACCKDPWQWFSVALESVTTEVMIRGFVAQVCAKLVYFNNSPEILQVKAVFPVDESAAVYYCEARLGGRTIVTQCMEKKKAEKVFDEAVKAGQTAVMTQEHGDTSDILKLNLGNLPAESRAEITLKMVMELKVQTDGGISFVLPTVLNPRYCPPGHPLRDIDCQIGGFFGPSAGCSTIVYAPAPYSIDVKAAVSGSHKIARIISSTDTIKTILAGDALSAQVCQDEAFQRDHDWSFLVYYSSPYKPHLLRETGDRSGTGIMKDDLLMLNFFPEVPENTYSNKNEIIFVIDRSGSMGGDKIRSAKMTLLLFLKSLPAGCLFNVVSFGSSFSHLFPDGSRVYAEATLKRACSLQETMDADMGGTEIMQPLKSIYSKPPTPGYSRQIILITDGEVWNVEQVCRLVGRHAHETRVFSVGIGSGVSSALVQGVARAGRGRSEMVAEHSRLQEKVMGLVSSMVQESVQEVTIACEVEPASRVTLVPKVPPVIFGGQHLILYARVPANTQVKSVTIRGQLGTKPLMLAAEGQQITTVHDEAKLLHRLAARAQILQWQLDEEEDVAEDMVALSTASGVVCQLTALVGVDKDSGHLLPKKPPVSTLEDLDLKCSLLRFMPRPRSRTRSSCSSTSSSRSWSTSSSRSSSPGLAANNPMFCANPAPRKTRGLFGLFKALSPSSPRLESCRSQPSAAAGPGVQCSQPSLPVFGSCGQTSGFGFSAALQGGGAPPPPPPPTAADIACGELRAECLEDEVVDQSLPLGEEHPSGLPLGEEHPSGLQRLVRMQQFDGSWTLEDAAKLTDMPLDALAADNPAKSETAWATALVLVLLERKFSWGKHEWGLLATKARAFITGCGEQLEDLLAKARNTLQEE